MMTIERGVPGDAPTQPMPVVRPVPGPNRGETAALVFLIAGSCLVYLAITAGIIMVAVS